MLKKLRIKQKLYLSSAITLMFIIFVGVASLTILDSVIHKTFPLEKTLGNVKALERTAMFRISQFFIKDIKSEEFYKTGESSNANDYFENIELCLENLNFLLSSKIVKKTPEISAELQPMVGLYEDYTAITKERLELIKQKGFYTYGLMGEMRKDSKDIEESFFIKKHASYRALVLEMRKNEKDYFLENDKKYYNAAKKMANEIHKILETEVDSGDKDRLVKDIDEYIILFNRVVAIDDEVARLTKEAIGLMDQVPVHGEKVFVLLDEVIEKRNREAKLIIYAFAISALVLSIFIQTYISAFISKPIGIVSSVLGTTAELDLTENSSYHKYTDYKNEIGVMSKSLNIMRSELRSMASVIKDSSNTINLHSEELASSSEEMAVTTKTIAEAMTDISRNNEHSAIQLHSISEAMSEFDAAMDEMLNKIGDIENCSENMHEMAVKSNADMQTTKHSVENVEKMFREFSSKINHLAEEINKISNITGTLSDISDQTNLLALNASIEAARAGEHGRGFAIVADEVRKLAELSMESSDNINQLIANISNEAGVIIETTKDVNRELNKQFDGVNAGIEAFSNIVNNVCNTREKVSDLTVLTGALGENKGDILNKVSNVADFSKTNTASSEEVSASSEELTFAMEKVAETASNLTRMTENMLGHTNKFKLQD